MIVRSTRWSSRRIGSAGKRKLRGTALATTITFEGVKSKEEAEQQQSGGGGLGGMLARRMTKKNDNPRATIFIMSNETLEVAPTVGDADIDVPAGFKLKLSDARELARRTLNLKELDWERNEWELPNGRWDGAMSDGGQGDGGS